MKREGRTRNAVTRDLARENYPAAVLLEPCPKCKVQAGTMCRRPNNSNITIQVPHRERTRLL